MGGGGGGRERERKQFKKDFGNKELNEGSCVSEIKTYGYVHYSDSTQTTELSTYNLWEYQIKNILYLLTLNPRKTEPREH